MKNAVIISLGTGFSIIPFKAENVCEQDLDEAGYKQQIKAQNHKLVDEIQTASGIVKRASRRAVLRANIFCISFLFFLLISTVYTEDRWLVAVKLTSPKFVEAEPGKIITCTFLVYNSLSDEESFIESLKIPSGWQSILPIESYFKLAGREKQVRLFAFSVPVTCQTGEYQIKYVVKNQRNYRITDSRTFTVKVLPVTKLEIFIESKPEVVIAGEDYQVRLRLINRGNSKTTIKLVTESNSNYSVKLEPSNVTLTPGESHTLQLDVKTDRKLERRFEHIIKIKTETEELQNSGIRTIGIISVDIIPRKTTEFDLFHRLPSQIRLIYVGRNEEKDFDIEFSGSGYLDEDRRRRISFLFRLKDIHEKSIYGERDEYRVSYYDKLLGIHFGDRNYFLSPLTTDNYGRGAEVNFHPKKLTFGSFYSESRWIEPKEKEIGTYLTYQLTDKFSLRGNFLQRYFDNYSNYDDKIYSAQTQIALGDKTKLDLEYGFSKTNREDKSDDNAYRINLDGNIFKYINYSFEKLRSGAKYSGRYNDSDSTVGTIASTIYRNLRLNFSYHDYKSNIALLPPVANRVESYQLGISNSFRFGINITNISLDLKTSRTQDYILPAEYDYEQQTLTLGLQQTFHKLINAQANIEKGKFEDKISTIKNDRLEKYSFYVYFHPGWGQIYTLYTIFGDSSFTQTSEKIRHAGISLNWRIMNNTCFNLDYQKNTYESNATGQENVFSTFIFTLPNNLSLLLKGYWFKYKEKYEKEFSFSLNYIIPWEIPVSRKKNIGTLQGKVYNVEKTSKSPIPNIILIANEKTAVTNNNGEFVFPALMPGTYFLQISKKSIGLNKITTEKLPVVLEVKSRETTKIEIGVVTSCKISGKISAFSFCSSLQKPPVTPKDNLFISGTGKIVDSRKIRKGVLKEARPLGNILVEITNEKETLQQLTDDENGKFSFEGIRPGKWKLKVYDHNLPAYHYLEKKEFQIELKPGEKKEIIAKVLPRHRHIQIIDTGEIE